MLFYGPDHKIKSEDDLLIIGSKELLEKRLVEQWLAEITNSGPSSEPPSKKQKTEQKATVIQQIVSVLSPTSDTDDIAITHVQTEGGVKKVTVAAVRTACSRHNTPTMAHAITAICKKVKSVGSLTVIVLLSDPTHALASGSAIARAHSQYTRKNSKCFGVPFSDETKSAVCDDDLVTVVLADCNKEDLPLITNTAHAIQLACRLVDAPPNELTTDSLVAEATEIAKKHKITPVIIRGEDLRKGGFGGIYGVGQAATCPPALVCLSYYPPNTNNTTKGGVALVGKGIVYDTGGLSIKTTDGMSGMKRDMGGAAGLLGAWDAAVSTKNTTKPLHLVLCIAENAVGPVATRPDDIHILYSGKSVEINNTDAEGRLVLGDGVAYAVKHLKPELIIDMATLTGAQGVATGKHFAGIYCNDEELEKQAVVAGKLSGDLCHPLPYAPEFFRGEFKSAVADMKNSVKNRANGQVSCAGQFIGNHLGTFQDTGKWLHVDMAYPSFDRDDERATGYGVALIQGILKALK